jgi:hypothetical protein
MPLRHGRHLPGEGPQLTSRVAAEEPAYLKVDHHGPAARRQVMNPPPAPAVDPGRRHTAPTAGRIRRPGPGRDQHGVPGVLDLVDLQAVQMREEQMQTAGFPACQAMVHNDPSRPLADDQFLVEHDLHEAAAPMGRLLRNRDHHGVPERIVTAVVDRYRGSCRDRTYLANQRS